MTKSSVGGGLFQPSANTRLALFSSTLYLYLYFILQNVCTRLQYLCWYIIEGRRIEGLQSLNEDVLCRQSLLQPSANTRLSLFLSIFLFFIFLYEIDVPVYNIVSGAEFNIGEWKD